MSIRGFLGGLIMRVCSLLPLQNKIVFSSFDGKAINDNPYWIYQELMGRDCAYSYIWLSYDPNIKVSGATVIKAYSIKALYHQATAKIWIFNSRQRIWMKKRHGQTYIQTWHGGISLKRIEKDAENMLPSYYVEEAKHDSSMIDYLVSGSNWNSKLYRRAFWYNGPILETGMPRSDVFYRGKNTYIQKVYKYYGIQDDTKLIIYAPTFRDDGSNNGYITEFDLVLSAAAERWGGAWKLLLRLHPNIKDNNTLFSFSENVIDASEYIDINELMIASSVLITDYSSCMFDAIEAKCRVILFTADLEQYMVKRGTYFDIDSLPFPVAKNHTELKDAILNYDDIKSLELINDFMSEHKIFNDGTASISIADLITSMM